MLAAVVPILLVSYVHLRLIFRNIKSLKFSEPYEVTGRGILHPISLINQDFNQFILFYSVSNILELRREIDVWSRAADSLSTYSKDEKQVRSLLLSKVVHLQNKLKAKIRMGG